MGTLVKLAHGFISSLYSCGRERTKGSAGHCVGVAARAELREGGGDPLDARGAVGAKPDNIQHRQTAGVSDVQKLSAALDYDDNDGNATQFVVERNTDGDERRETVGFVSEIILPAGSTVAATSPVVATARGGGASATSMLAADEATSASVKRTDAAANLTGAGASAAVAPARESDGYGDDAAERTMSKEDVFDRLISEFGISPTGELGRRRFRLVYSTPAPSIAGASSRATSGDDAVACGDAVACDDADVEEEGDEEDADTADNADFEFRTEGHEWLEKRIARSHFAITGHGSKKKMVYGTIVGWINAEANSEEGEAVGTELWRARYDDGDEEDLEEHETREAVAKGGKDGAAKTGAKAEIDAKVVLEAMSEASQTQCI